MAHPTDFVVTMLPSALTACRFAGDHPGALPQVFAMPAPKGLPGEAPESTRARARHAARAALQHLLAEEFRCTPDAIVLSNVRGQPVQALAWPHVGLSISYAADTIVLALFAGGEVGADLAAIDPAGCTDELWRTAVLYLPPGDVSALGSHTSSAAFSKAFVDAWTRQEARLKCVRQPLVEWSSSVESKFAGLRVSGVVLPDWACLNHVAAVAWRPLARPWRTGTSR